MHGFCVCWLFIFLFHQLWSSHLFFLLLFFIIELFAWFFLFWLCRECFGWEWLWMVEVVVVLTLVFWMVRIEFGVMIVLVVGVQLLCVFFFFVYLLFICFLINVIFCPWFCGWFWWFHAGIYAHFVSKRRGYGPSEAESCAAGWTQQRSVPDNEHNSARGRSSLAAVLTRGLVKRVNPVAMARRLRGWILIVLWLLLNSMPSIVDIFYQLWTRWTRFDRGRVCHTES